MTGLIAAFATTDAARAACRTETVATHGDQGGSGEACFLTSGADGLRVIGASLVFPALPSHGPAAVPVG
jgi:hypothetical protein